MTYQFHSAIYLRVATNPTTGFGHMSRMLALRKVFKEPVKWFVDPRTKKDVSEWVPKTDEVYEESAVDSIAQLQSATKAQPDGLIICDSYNVSCKGLGVANIPTVYFCDSDTWQIFENVTIINCQPGAMPHKNCFAGPRFMPIDTRGKQQAKVDFTTVPYPIRCLIGFGAVDSGNMTAFALDALLSDEKLRESVQPICLLGPHFKYGDIVETLLGSFAKSKIVRNCSSVLDLPYTCDIAIGAPGVSHAERLYAGIPTVLLPQNDKHVALCMGWQNEGCALYARAEPQHIASQINSLIANQFEQARAISMEGQRVIDGKGASRIVAEINFRGLYS
jgi:spore coat polysaccharide biosynthesis predicted glycosyltransferase SpsG